MKTLICCLILVGIFSCKKTESDTIAPEYPDWYTLKAPVDREIQGVWGDRDKTLLISTMSAIFRSTDKGQNWQQVHQQSTGMFGVVAYKDTLFTMNGLLNQQALINADNYSVDDGKTWQRYTKRNSVFDPPSTGSTVNRFLINPVTGSNGVAYKINQVFLDGPTATTGRFETPGVITSNGRRIDLPQLHQLHSIYLDSQERLYISGTDAICEKGDGGQKFSFCNSVGGRGVVYISKKPLP